MWIKKNIKAIYLLLLRSSMNIVHPLELVCALCIICIGKYSCIGIFPMHQLNNYVKIFITINNYMSYPTIKCLSIIIALHIICYPYDIHIGLQLSEWITLNCWKISRNTLFKLLPWKHDSNYPFYSPKSCL